MLETGGDRRSPSLRWLRLLRVDCCGDSVLGFALHRAGVHGAHLDGDIVPLQNLVGGHARAPFMLHDLCDIQM